MCYIIELLLNVFKKYYTFFSRRLAFLAALFSLIALLPSMKLTNSSIGFSDNPCLSFFNLCFSLTALGDINDSTFFFC